MPSGSLDSLNLPFADSLLQGGIAGAENLRGFTWGEELWRVNDPGWLEMPVLEGERHEWLADAKQSFHNLESEGYGAAPESCKEVPLDGTFRNKLKEYSASSMGFFRRLRRNERHRLPATL